MDKDQKPQLFTPEVEEALLKWSKELRLFFQKGLDEIAVLGVVGNGTIIDTVVVFAMLAEMERDLCFWKGLLLQTGFPLETYLEGVMGAAAMGAAEAKQLEGVWIDVGNRKDIMS